MLLRSTCVGTVVLMLGLDGANGMAEQQSAPAPSCRADGAVVPIAELPEASGIAASRTVPGRLWAHNDSGTPELLMLDARGQVTGRVRVSGASVVDWEAVAVAPCSAGSCLYIADIGDNNGIRKQITVYQLPEPRGDGPAAVSGVFHATYPDGRPRDAETLLATPDGALYILTKGNSGPAALYRFPRDLRSGATARLEQVGKPRPATTEEDDERITDGDVTPDGEWIALRTHRALVFYRTANLVTGDWRQEKAVDLAALREPQGEGITFGSDGSVYVTGEGGGSSQPGTFARLTCTR